MTINPGQMPDAFAVEFLSSAKSFASYADALRAWQTLPDSHPLKIRHLPFAKIQPLLPKPPGKP